VRPNARRARPRPSGWGRVPGARYECSFAT
jgi:hypothetical protein